MGDVDYVAVSLPAAGSTLLAEVGDDGTGDCAALKIVSQVDIFEIDGTSVLATGKYYCRT